MAQILVVDDVVFIAKMIAEIFEADGHEVKTATSGTAALELARMYDPDLILLDYKMTDMDGLEVVRQLRQDRATHMIPIMMVSSVGDLNTIAAAFAADVTEYVVKPFQTEELVEKAEHLLGGFRMNYSVLRRTRSRRSAATTPAPRTSCCWTSPASERSKRSR